jgi:2-dehydro-3-deoxygluconokinase
MGLFRAGSVGSLAQVSDFHLGIGGAESNVAIGVARLGGEATWIGRVGADGLGQRVLREIRAEGVTVQATMDDTASTGLMIKERRTADATRVNYYRAGSAGSRLAAADLDPDVIRSADLLHVTGITPALSATASKAVASAVDIAVGAGVPVSFDINHRASLWADRGFVEVYRLIAASATIVFASDDEASLVVDGSTPLELANNIALLGPTQVIIKLGARGCATLIDGVERTASALAITPIDTVGAGDAFVAGYLTELLAGAPVEQRLATAVRTGAFACLGPGDWESYARRDELGLLDGGDPVIR